MVRNIHMYFHSHHIIMITNQLMHWILYIDEQLLKCAIELIEFDISYQSCTAIKAQVLANFVIEIMAIDESTTC